MGVSIMGPAPKDYLEQIGKTGNLQLLEEDPYLLRGFSERELETVGKIAIIDGDPQFADRIVQHFFEQALVNSPPGSEYNRDCARTYLRLEALLDGALDREVLVEPDGFQVERV